MSVCLLLLLVNNTAYCQTEYGGVVGSVVDGETGEPLPGANIVVVGSRIGAASDGDGNFVLERVPVGEQTIEAHFLGYRSSRTQVTIRVDEEVTVNFSLRTSALELDDIFVTGQARETRRREIGSSVVSISAEDLQDAPVTSLSQLLQGRAPGVLVQQSGGAVGAASNVLLRGPTSLTQGVQPVIYIDGVRMDNSTAAGVHTGANAWSGLDDINFADVERVEIIKGAAASTLYGTQAASGVIQIFTKEGRREPRPTSWTFQSQAGANYTPLGYFDNISVYADWFHSEIMRTGYYHQQQLSATGQVGGYQYYASLSYSDMDGVYTTNSQENISFRGNLQFLPREDLVVRVNQAISQRDLFYPQDGDNTYSLIGNGLVGGPRGRTHVTTLMKDYEVILKSLRYQGGLSAEYQPTDNLTTRMNLGVDIFNSDNTELIPYGLVDTYEFGRRSNYRRSSTMGTIELSTNYVINLTDNITSNLTTGFQGISHEVGTVNAYGENFAMPGLSVVGATAVTTGTESRTESREYGLFMQERLGFYDILYMTFGLRGDRHSAFGIDYGWGIYPSIGFSYIMSEHGVFSDIFGNNEFRVRAQYGQAGRPPGIFAPIRTWTVISGRDGQMAITSSNIGNPDLGPEVSNEYEFGFDLGILDGRINAEFTYYNQRTSDALLNVRFPPSLGFHATQLENVAEIKNIGYEFAVNASVIKRPNFSWTFGYNLSYNENEILEMADVPETTVQFSQKNRVGYPVGSFFADRYILRDGEVIVENDAYIGPSFPVRQMQFTSNFNFLRNISLNVLLDYAGGHYIQSWTFSILSNFIVGEQDPVLGEEYWNLPSGVWAHNIMKKARELQEIGEDHLDLNHYDDPAMAAYVLGAVEGAFEGPLLGNRIRKADYWRLREITLGYNIPEQFIRGLGIRNASIFLSARNLWRKTDKYLVDTEADYHTGNQYSQTELFMQPLSVTYIFGVRFNF